MSLSFEKIVADLKEATRPELEKRAEELRSSFLTNIEEFIDSSKIDVIDDLLKKAADYEIKAVTESDRERATQYATASENVLRQISVILVTERVVAEKTFAAMIEKAAIAMWDGFKSAAVGVISIAAKGALTGLLGPAGGALADAAGEFLGDAVNLDGGTES